MGWKEDFVHLLFDESDMEKAMMLYSTNRPETIFRFRKGTEDDINTLKNNQIWLSRLNAVNDMFEGTFELDIEDIDLHFEILKDALLQNAIEVEDKIISKFFVCCFCENLLSVPMWSYYSDYHKGFCIEYAIDEFKDPVFPVIYTDNKKVKQPYAETWKIDYGSYSVIRK